MEYISFIAQIYQSSKTLFGGAALADSSDRKDLTPSATESLEVGCSSAEAAALGPSNDDAESRQLGVLRNCVKEVTQISPLLEGLRHESDIHRPLRYVLGSAVVPRWRVRSRQLLVSLPAVDDSVHRVASELLGGRQTSMKVSTEVSADKLRGGFYSPEPLVRVCLDRAASLLVGQASLRVLEPSAGDGAFFAGLSRHDLGTRVTWMTGVEIIEQEAALCSERLAEAPFEGEVVQGSALAWCLENDRLFDLALGNPPFVRFQFVEDTERSRALALGLKLGTEFKGVSNLWIPVFASAINALRPGGVFSFIVPAESFTGISGFEIREWLLDRTERLHVDLFPPASFPDVLQEVVVLSGRIISRGVRPSRNLYLREHSALQTREWTHSSVGKVRTWTRYLLSPSQVASLEEAAQLSSVVRLGDVARFEVATVTGANSFFCVDEATITKFQLHRWARPLLPRTRHAVGLVYTRADHLETCEDGRAGYLLDFAASRPDPMMFSGARAYLSLGEAAELPKRFKCRIRSPWYRVPVVPPGALMMAKRSHLHPRVIVNDAGVLTTDTIYRGRLIGKSSLDTRALTAGFHNSLTLLTSEIEGRSFGGGVLELVPSEISRLLVPIPAGITEDFDRLDCICRNASDEDVGESLVRETDQLLVKRTPGLATSLMDQLQDARSVLLGLRLARN